MCFCRTLLAGSGLPKTSHAVLIGFVAIIILMCSKKHKKSKWLSQYSVVSSVTVISSFSRREKRFGA